MILQYNIQGAIQKGLDMNLKDISIDTLIFFFFHVLKDVNDMKLLERYGNDN